MTDDIEPPESDELFDQEEMLQEAIQQAQQYHSIMDSAKEWSRETTTDLRIEAALEDDEEAADRIEQIAAIVRTVTERIEQGDNNRARSVGR
jgi:hypothetical protein